MFGLGFGIGRRQLRNLAGRGNRFPMYSASVAFLRIRRIKENTIQYNTNFSKSKMSFYLKFR